MRRRRSQPSARDIERATLALLHARGAATACPSEIARAVGGATWRDAVPAVRAVVAQLQARGLVDAYQHGRPIDIATARGPLRLRTTEPIDYRAHPERYVIGRGEQGVLTVEPYKSELLPLWRFKTPREARTSARTLYAAFLAYGRAHDFVGMDMARKYLQMGYTRARRYANHASDRKYDERRRVLPASPDATKSESAAIFRAYWDKARANRTYARLRREHLAHYATPRSSPSPRTRAARRTRGAPA